MLELCAEQQERLVAAKEAYAANPTAETLAAKRAAMAEMHRLRRWLRENGRPVLPGGDGVMVAGDLSGEPARPAGRVRRLG